MFYDTFSDLCKAKGMSPAAVTREIGLNNSSSTAWKRGSMPKSETLQKLADYFGVSTDYLIGKPSPFVVRDNDVIRRTIKKMVHFDTAKIDQEIEKELSYDPAYKALEKIGEALGKLNGCGQKEAVKRVEELTELPRYQAKKKQK